MAITTYQHTTTTFNPETGEITADTNYSVSAANGEDDYIKVYKYLNVVFASQGINPNLVPALIEISNYMTYADKGQIVILVKSVKDQIRAALGQNGKPLSTARMDAIIKQLKDADILRSTGERATYAVNPFVVARGKWSDIKELRVQFDAVADQLQTTTQIHDQLTGKTIKKIITQAERPKKSTKKVEHDVPGQMSLDDYQQPQKQKSKNKFNNFQQNDYDFDDLERALLSR